MLPCCGPCIVLLSKYQRDNGFCEGDGPVVMASQIAGHVYAMDIMWIMYSEWTLAALHGLVHVQIDEVVCEFNTSTNNLVF